MTKITANIYKATTNYADATTHFELLGTWKMPALPATGNTVIAPDGEKLTVTGVTWMLTENTEECSVNVRTEKSVE